MFVSLEQLEYALRELDRVHPFWGTSFLAFKRLGLLVGKLKQVDIADAETEILDMHYNPVPNSRWYYVPLRSSGPKNRWMLKTKYSTSGLQKTRTTTFRDIFLHPTEDEWAWADNYVQRLGDFIKTKQKGLRVPAFALAVWLFRSRDWPSNTTPEDIQEVFFREFGITQEERRKLFADVPIQGLLSKSFQEMPNSWRDLRQVIGSPRDAQPDEGGILDYLELTDVGPARRVTLDLSERLNIITGDNGSGKTFLLECIWWALSGQWADQLQPAFPHAEANKPSIKFHIAGSPDRPKAIYYNKETASWPQRDEKRPVLPGILLYARVNGSFALWDPIRNYGPTQSLKVDSRGLVDVFRFSENNIWNGLDIEFANGSRQVVCNGLIRDWVTWQFVESAGEAYSVFTKVLHRLSPHTQETLKPGKPIKLHPDDRLIPTLDLPYGPVPITQASAGIKRILGIAYLLVWAWEAHKQASKQLGRLPQSKFVIIVDEIEAHLHPQWQRVIIPALLDVMAILATGLEIQFISATHSPLVMASVEPRFDSKIDKIFSLELVDRQLAINEIAYMRHGSANSWLTSNVFDLQRAYSVEAEQALLDAKRLQQSKNPSKQEIQEVTNRLVRFLPETDEFWPRWKYYAERHEVTI